MTNKKNFSSLVKTMSHKELDKTIDNLSEMLSDLRDLLKFIYPYKTEEFFTFDKEGSHKFSKLAKEEIKLLKHRPFSGSKYLMNREFNLDFIFGKVSDAIYRSFNLISLNNFENLDPDDALMLASKYHQISDLYCKEECLLLDKCFLKEDSDEDKNFECYKDIYEEFIIKHKYDEEYIKSSGKEEIIKFLNYKYAEMIKSIEILYRVFLECHNDLCILYVELVPLYQ